jgi:hypothetical protein
MKPQFWMVFDIESVGLHGEGFAYAAVVMSANGVVVEEFGARCDPKYADGTSGGREWVEEAVPKNLPGLDSVPYPLSVRDHFWAKWEAWRAAGAYLAADCAWPVEANFLSACVRDDADSRGALGPYPLIDIGSVLFACGMNPLAEYKRENNELPPHNPLNDARQSARLLREALHIP